MKQKHTKYTSGHARNPCTWILRTFLAIPTHMMNICAKFHLTKIPPLSEEILCEIGVIRQWTDSGKTARQRT